MSTSSSRIDFLLNMLAKKPDDARAHFGLAVEYERLGRWDEVVSHLERYLDLADDEGNGFARLGRAFRRIGKEQEAREAFQRGIESALRHGHPSLAAELEDELKEEDL